MSAVFYDGDIALTTGRVKSATIYATDLDVTKPPFTVSADNGCKYVNVNYNGYGYFDFQMPTIANALWIIKDKVPQGKFNEVYENQTSTWTKCIELSNGNYIAAKYRQTTTLTIGAFASNDAPLFTTERHFGFGGGSNETTYIGIAVYIDEDNNDIFANFIVYSFRQMTSNQWHYLQTYSFGGNIAGFNWISGSTPPAYLWQPVPYLAGNDNQFYMALSQIDESIIGDGLTNVTTQDESKFIINEISNISRLLANIPNNTETVIAYSSNNYMTVTRRWSEGIAPYNNIFFIFKLYSSDDQLLYTAPEVGVTDPAVPRKYLSFIKDDEQEAAMIDIITYNQNNGTYVINNMPLPEPTVQEMNNIWTWLQGSSSEPESNDPYATGSTDDGGEPGNPRPQDHITDTPAPTLSGTNLGIITLYQPDDTELLKISDFLWSDDVLDNFKKYFNNFADNILALYILPFTPANLPTKIFKVGKLASEDSALQSVSYCTQRYYDIDMGSVEIGQRWGSYLDYSPYTKIEVYLPYCGLHSLDIDELMSPAQMSGTLPIKQGCTLSLKYRMDILTGVIVAKLLVNGDVRYQFNGKAGSNIPLTGQTYSNWLGSIVTAGSAAAITIATGGMTAPLVAGSAASVAGTVLAQKPNVESIGNISGDASMLATNIPYVRISSPNKPLLENQEVFTGYPSYKSGTVGSFSGYTEFVDAHVEGISCTEEERAEIISLLKAGVII